MFKIIKKTVLSLLSILGLGFLFWTILLLNPALSYANETTFDIVTIYHNNPLSPNTKDVIEDALDIIKKSELYNEEITIDLCLNDDNLYPNLWIYQGGLAYAFYDKAVINDCLADFQSNKAIYTWATNNNQMRQADLTWLIAHEFTHNLQSYSDRLFPLKYDFWKSEGYAEYIAHQWKNDGQLKSKIVYFLEEEKKEKIGVPVIYKEDGTIIPFYYYQYGISIQYLIEEKGMTYEEICKKEISLDSVKTELINFIQ